MIFKAAQQGFAGVVGVAVLTGCSSPGFFRTDELLTVTETSTKLVPTATTITSAANPVTRIGGEGTFGVGDDVAAGRYTTDGPRSPGGICLWRVLPQRDSAPEQAVYGGFAEGPGQFTVSLGQIVQIQGDCIWTLT
ncbi:MAG: hypothetical protein K0R68_2284 [Mycobacterium sp.]|nr:hypothetical protein [Mycobacterium sp.]